MPVTLRSAVLGELAMTSVPVLKALPGLAADAVKFAPEPTVMPTAARTTASAPRVRRGCAARRCRRVTGGSSRETDEERPSCRGAVESPGAWSLIGVSRILLEPFRQFGATRIPYPQKWGSLR